MLRYVMSCSLCQDETVMFCSPFRRRRKTRRPEESQLSREEAWSLYWAKLEEEANYFSVGDTAEDEDTDICTCHTCIVSEEQLSQNMCRFGACFHLFPQRICHMPLLPVINYGSWWLEKCKL